MRLVSLILFTTVVAGASLVPYAGAHRMTFQHICQLVSDKFFRDDAHLNEWKTDCRKKSLTVSLWWTRSRFLREVQEQLNQLEASHLAIYDPQEDRRLWLGEAVDTGLRLRWIEGHYVVFEVLSQSAAAKGGVVQGDELLLINEEAVQNRWQAESTSGHFLFRRGEKQVLVYLRATPLKIDHAPEIEAAAQGIAWLKIPSFRAEYFKEESWISIVQQLLSFKKIIVDLRGNSGGNLVAMLRALSPLMCQKTTVGHLAQPRRPIAEGPPPEDNLDEMVQIQAIEKFKSVPLATFSRYGCVPFTTVVLIDANSSSVSEIFAQAMLTRPHTRVMGQNTAGDVLLATWYSLDQLGVGYSISIPEASYLSESGESLEGTGVWPQEELQYDLQETLQGKDTWLLRAIAYLVQAPAA